VIESGAGREAGFPDDAYRERGIVVGTREEAFGGDVILRVRASAGTDDPGPLHSGQILIGLGDPLGSPGGVARMAARGVTLFALELLPRISRAQSMDVLSSQATVAGYRAALIAAQTLPKMFPLLTTAAGTLAPARVLVIGAGVAGLQAIATARRLGAVVEAYDIRTAVKEEVESLGARFVELPPQAGQEGGSGGYAEELSEESLRRQRELLGETVSRSDVVITTAQVPARRAPVIVTAEMVTRMSPGSVVVDLAAEQGGNCELTRAAETVVTEGGVRLVGPVNVPSSVAHHASQMYARNVAAFLLHLLHEGEVVAKPSDPIGWETLVCRDGAVVHPAVLEALGVSKREVSA
jgi:NAD(P) transhydrogenase subunit alpha